MPDVWLTTNHVVLETIRLTKRAIGQEAAVAIGKRLYGEKLARIHWTTPREEKDAFEYLARHGDQRYGSVDCITFVVMEAYGIPVRRHAVPSYLCPALASSGPASAHQSPKVLAI